MENSNISSAMKKFGLSHTGSHASFGGVTNPYEVPKVLLAPVSDNQQEDGNLEPPYVRERWTNIGNIYIDCRQAIQLRPFTWSVNTSQFQLKVPGINRLALIYFSMPWYVNNVNSRNNTFRVRVGISIFTCTIPIDAYLTLVSLATAIQTALNAMGAPVTFTVTAQNNQCLRVNATGNFQILASDALTRGLVCHGLAPMALPATVYVGSMATLLYTRYLEIQSPELLQYTKNPNRGNNISANTLSRLHFEAPGSNILAVEYISPQTSINWNNKAAITNVTVSIVDEYNEEPPLDTSDSENAAPSLVFVTQN